MEKFFINSIIHGPLEILAHRQIYTTYSDPMLEQMGRELREFALNTSGHGLRHMFHGHRCAIRLVFSILWVSAVSFCIFRASLSVRKYIAGGTTSRYEMHPASAAAIMKFPTITACNNNKVRKSYLDAKPEYKNWWQGVSTFNFKLLESINWTDPVMAKHENETYAALLRDAQMYNDTFISCTQGHIRYCHDTDMGMEYYERDVEFVSGSCFRINPAGNLHGKSGDYGVLSLIFLADREEYSDSRVNVGWVLAVHEAETHGASVDNGINISPGYAYYINLDTMNIRSNDEHCSETRGKSSGYGRYDQATCLLDCRDRLLNATCGCLNTTPPRNTAYNYKPCTLKEVATCSLRAYLE